MIPDKVIYTDGHDVTVTDTALQVKHTSYKLNGIIKHGLFILRADRIPGILLFIIGALIIVGGVLDFFPNSLDVHTDTKYMSANSVAILIGSFLALLGIILAVIVRERYAVRIATAEGEKNAIVSYKKEYISQIVDALNQAVAFLHNSMNMNINTPSSTTTYIPTKE